MSEQISVTAPKERVQIDARWKWRLEDIFASNDAWEAVLSEAREKLPELAEAVTGVSGATGKDEAVVRAAALKALDMVSAIESNIDELYTYARMRRDEDTRAALYQGLVQRAESLSVEFGAISSGLRPALLALPDGALEGMIGDKAFAEFDEQLRQALRLKPHVLPAEQEALIAQAGEVFSAPGTIFDMLSDADMKFPTIKDEDGNDVEVTSAKYGTLVESQDRRVRQEAYDAHNGAFKAFGSTIAAAYTGSVKGDIYGAKTHRYESSRESSLYPHSIPLSVYDNLVEAVHAHLPALAKYMRTRRAAMGVSELHMYDQYVNLEKEFKMKLPYPEGYAMVMDALKPLGAEYISQLKKAYEDGWIDVYENAGKASGAYSWGTYGSHPYVLLNYDDGTFNDVSTVAHEMGHAMHSFYSYANQPYAKSGYSLFTAEVASTVNEIILSIYLLDKHKETSARRYLIGELLSAFRGTVFRQTMFAEFERESHAMAERGEALTAESLSAMYRALNETYFGEGVTIDEIVGAEWMRIPHFYRAFYVYQYATGFSAAAYIARRITREGEGAVEDYKRFLKAGGSVPPIEALKLAGVDMSKKEAVDEALNWFDELVDEYAGMF